MYTLADFLNALPVVCCFISWGIATTVLVGRRVYVARMEDGAPAETKFSLKSESLPYVSLWAVFSITSVVFGVFAGPTAGFYRATLLLGLEFAAISVWGHYYGNGHLVCSIVLEAQERSWRFLQQSFGVDTIDPVQFKETIGTVTVELWTKFLKEMKKWSTCTRVEIDDLLFETSMRCASVILDKIGENALDVIRPFFHEWQREVEDLRGHVRVPRPTTAPDMSSGERSEALSCLALMIANEDPELRSLQSDAQQQLTECQIRAAWKSRRKAALDRILKWPLLLQSPSRLTLEGHKIDASDLFINRPQGRFHCSSDELPLSVHHTLLEIILAGYIKQQGEEIICVDVAFRDGKMIFDKDQWNKDGMIQMKPFQYVTSVGLVDENVAFVVEKTCSGSSDLNGSGVLEGTLKFQGKAGTLVACPRSLQTAVTSVDETVWGIGIIDMKKPISVMHRPMMWMIELAWCVFGWCRHPWRCLNSLRQELISTPNLMRLWRMGSGTSNSEVEILLSDSRQSVENDPRTTSSEI